MSLEITLYPKKASKNKLIQFLIENNFVRTKHIISSLNDDKNIHFIWFGYTDFESFTGVEATVLQPTPEDISKYKCTDWILHTRTRSSGSHKDKEMQNLIIRKARKLFGGSFYNDWYGTNRYTNINDYQILTAPERGLALMLVNLHDKIFKLEQSIIAYENPISKNFESIKDDDFREYMKMNDPSIILYNSLLPFAVSLIEYLFSETFEIVIKYNAYSKKVIEEENLKIPLKDVLAITRNELNIETLISRDYTFQNLSHVNKAYKKYLDIDVLKILSQRKKIGNRFYLIREKIEEIIEKRHLMIHHFEFDPTFQRNDLIEILYIIQLTADLVIEYIEKKNKWNIIKLR